LSQGGHADAYVDPSTGIPYNYGVKTYLEIANASAFFHRMNVPTGTKPRTPLVSTYVDFTDGKNVRNPPPANIPTSDAMDAVKRYLVECRKYEDMLLPGYWNFPEPKNIPDDLLLPFRDFVAKYNLTAALPLMFEATSVGVSDVLDQLTIWVMQAFGSTMAAAITGQLGSFVPASHNNQELYDSISKLLGNDVLYQSVVERSARSASGVQLMVRGLDGDTTTTIHAKRLLIAIEPTEDNMLPFDMDANENGVWRKWDYSRLYVGIVTHSSLPINGSLINTPSSVQAGDIYGSIPKYPLNARYDYSGAPSKLFETIMVGGRDFTAAEAKKKVTDGVANMIRTGCLPAPQHGEDVDFVAFEEHGPMHLRVSAEHLKAGFIQDLYSLQGQRSTFYTGAAFSVQFTTSLWQFTDTVLPKLVEGI